jgi:mono/diheme cytochrome c family protein
VGTFSGTVTFDDGSEKSFSGSWTASGGQFAADGANPGFNVEMLRAGGVRIETTSTASVCLYLLRDPSDTDPDPDVRSGQQFAPGAGSCVASIDLPASAISSQQYAVAYYAEIDQNNERDTLAKWQTFNGFGTPAVVDGHVRFRDTRDLGYGRNMFFRVNANGTFASFVDNFQVQTIPGQEYSALNLEAMIADDRQYHIGTNGIEYSCVDPTNCDCTANPNNCFVKFFTFLPADANGVQRRALAQDLDGRGDKPMPGICVTCHGGKTPPLELDGTFPDEGNTNSKLQLLEVDTFEYGTGSGLTRADQEAELKELNTVVYCTYPGADPAVCAGVGITSPVAAAGDWQGNFAVQLAEGCYSDGGGVFAETRYGGSDGECDFVPAGWQPDPGDGNPPAGADQLFLNVVRPHCVVCHARRGSDLGTELNAGLDGKDIDLSSWDKFISHADQIERLVFDEGNMPLALLNYNVFWADPNKPALLGSFLPGFRHGNADGTTQMPGDPVADPGPDRVTTVPIRLSAAASHFSENFSWQIVASPDGSAPVLSNPLSVRPTFTTDLDGEYRFRLTVANGDRQNTAIVTITVDSTLLPASSDLTFDTDISAMLEANCSNATCHQQDTGNGGIEGVPVFWNATDAGQSADKFYLDALARVNFADPEASLILRKPSGNHHYGGQQAIDAGFDVDDVNARDNYDLLLNWILAGARR